MSLHNALTSSVKPKCKGKEYRICSSHRKTEINDPVAVFLKLFCPQSSPSFCWGYGAENKTCVSQKLAQYLWNYPLTKLLTSVISINKKIQTKHTNGVETESNSLKDNNNENEVIAKS